MCKKYFYLFFLGLFMPLAAWAVGVDEKEIKSQTSFKFINSPDTSGSDTVRAIKGIGRNLAISGNSGAYSVIHAIGPKGEKFDADIILIGKNATVNHIKNIRRIIEGYLVQKYKYSQQDAASLALFVTYYNGFYRKNINYFKENYKPVVTRHITPQNVGLDRKYSGWPGKSRIIIPLSDGGEKPDAGKIGEKDVMEEVRKNEKKTKDRENITKLQEKEIQRKERQITKQKEQITKRKENIAEKEKNIQEEKKKNENNPNAEDKKKKEDEIAKKEEEIRKEKEEVKKEEENVAKEDKKIEERKTEIAQNKQNIQADKNAQARAEQRKNETPAQREARLDAKEKELKENRKEDSIFGGNLYYLRVRDFSSDGKYRNDFYIIDPKNRKVRVKSPYTGIVGKKFDVVDKDVIVIGEKKTPAGVKHYLVRLDGETLIDKKYGSDEVFWRGFVEVRENEIYAIVNHNDAYYLGKFDKDLKLLQRSEVKVYEDTFFSFYENTIYVNSADRKIEVLNRADLKAAGSIIP
ncbi:MAG: hypothetical protein LDLANPLL_01105 [Turneriella sp.]|nr:hypothetical protein [Turneriella sp.]